MHKFVIALAMTLFASVLVVSPVALAETAQQNKLKDCNEQANTKGPGVGIGIGILGIGQGKSDERKVSMTECPSAKPVKSGKAAPQKNEGLLFRTM
jgi:hypothetical protein